MENEEWRAIPGFEGEYEVSSLGRVRSLDRIERGPRKSRRVGRLLKPDGSKPYLVVFLPGDGKKQKRHSVHRLVALTFLGRPPDEKPLVDHINEDKRDNRAANLRYVDSKENRDYSAGAGLSGVKWVQQYSGSPTCPWQVKVRGKWKGQFKTLAEAAAVASLFH